MANRFVLTIPAAKVPTVRDEAKAQGVDLTQAYGTLPESHGVALDYQVVYVNDGDAVVGFTIKSKPFYVSVDMVQNGVKGLLGL